MKSGYYTKEGIRFKNVDYVATAIEKGIDVNKARDWLSDMPPLLLAVGVYKQDPQIVRLLLQNGANVHLRLWGRIDRGAT